MSKRFLTSEDGQRLKDWIYDPARDQYQNQNTGMTITSQQMMKADMEFLMNDTYKQHIGLDFETYGSVDLPKHGLYRYVDDEYFRPLVACLYTQEPGQFRETELDFVNNPVTAENELRYAIKGKIIIAHNVPFEAAVLARMGIEHPIEDFIDSAVVARAAGAGSKLEAAAPQLLGTDKMAEGWPLIKLFSMPGKYQEKNGCKDFDPAIVADHPDEWLQFIKYCTLDAKLSFGIVFEYLKLLTPAELQFHTLTLRMNGTGWNVDLDLVKEMQRRYLENLEYLEQDFRERTGAKDLNLNSHPQLVAWCKDRGIMAKSFDEKNCTKLRNRIVERLQQGNLKKAQREAYEEVVMMLTCKKELGGSSLKKLQTILDTVANDGRLRDQYLHCGAGQTLRTTGRSVQMQNLKRLGAEPDDVSELLNDQYFWNNEKLARNLRQVFCAEDPNGVLIVGDFSSVEARGLAWMAGEEWKLSAFRNNQDLYKVAAARQYSIAIDAVTKEQRQFGKVGELSCGYQAGPGAVKDFAENMGVILSEAEAAKVVSDWRDANPNIVKFWYRLDGMLRNCVEFHTASELHLPDGFKIVIKPMATPASLQKLAPDSAVSVSVEVVHDVHGLFLRRVFLGCHFIGKSIRYYKPSERKTGDLWRPQGTDPKTGKPRDYTIYGGKLAGILTQSFCRELFFRVALNVQRWCDSTINVRMIGQFHDELVLEFSTPESGHAVGRREAEVSLRKMMSDAGIVTSFPLAADVHSDYRYIK
jgi:DNA polymerase